MAKREDPPAGNAGEVTSRKAKRPRIVFLHFTAPPIVGGVEGVIGQQVRLFRAAGYPTVIVAGRRPEGGQNGLGEVVIIPEIDSEYPEYLELRPALEQGKVPEQFDILEDRIEKRLQHTLRPTDIVIAHNILTTHFNLTLTAAVHRLARHGLLAHLIVWCHDISRHVNPERKEVQYRGEPWDLLRTRIPGAAYVAVSSSRRDSLAAILDCPPDLIQVIPNGVDPSQLLGLSELGRHLIEEFDLFSADLIVLMPVRITKVKNVEYALHVIEELKRSGQDVRLVITGPPDPHVEDISDYFEALMTLRDQLHLREDVIFIHEGTSQYPSPLVIQGGAVGELYRVADLILMPSIREGFGMPVLEAGLVDRPVFATSMPVMQDLPEFQFLIEKDESPDSVARRIVQWAEGDAAHRLRREVRNHFTWSRIFSKQIVPLVERVAVWNEGAAA